MTTAVHANFPGTAGAEFSADRQYRYLLWRTWDATRPRLGIIMLNPSVAAEATTDPTTTQNVNRARRSGYGGIVQGNLYAYCATDPRALKRAGYPIGDLNNAALDRIATDCPDILLACGSHAQPARFAAVRARLKMMPRPPRLYHLGLVGAGLPRHPLRVGYDVQLQEFA